MHTFPFRVFYLLLLLTFITQQVVANTAPTAPSLVFPVNGNPDYKEDFILFSWEKSNDIDSDPILYDLFLGTSEDNLTLLAGDIILASQVNDTVFIFVDDELPDQVNAFYINYLLPNTQYYWKVVAKDDQGGIAESDIWIFTIGDVNIYAPTIPEAPTPANSASNVDLKPTLSWLESTDRDQHTVIYDIYFDTQNPPTNKIATALANPSFNVSQELQGNSTYFWKVVANDGNGRETSSAVWEFNTRNRTPSSAMLSFPENGSSGVHHNTSFTWLPATDPDNDELSYELWYGTTILPDKRVITDHTEVTAPLSSGTTYYWKVVTVDSRGDQSESEVWSFTTDLAIGNTAPSLPTLIFPVGEATEVVLEPTIQWQQASDADGNEVMYDLYLGSHPDSLKLEATDLSVTTYDLILPSGTTYYWQVVAYDGQGGVVNSEIERFTTTAQDIELSLLRTYYRYGHPTLLFEYQQETMTPAFDNSIPSYSARGSSDIKDAVALVLYYDNTETIVNVDVPEGFTVSESITYTNGLPSNATRRFKIEGDFSSGPTAKVTLQQGVAIRSYDVELTVNKPPTKPVLLEPSSDESEVSLNPVFTWDGGDDPEGGDMLYRLLLGTSIDALEPAGFAFGSKAFQSQVQGLSPGQQYAWKIIATDLDAESTESDVAYFRTADVVNASLAVQYPREISTYVDTETPLIWSFNTADNYRYEVFLDVNPDPRSIAQNIEDTHYTVSGLAHNTKYYWKVVAHNDEGVVESSQVRQFITKPADGNETGIIVDDRDGKVYQWADINGQKWMTHNLAYEPEERDGYYGYEYWHTNRDLSKKSYSALLHQTSNVDKYGYLYDWNATINPDALTDTSRYVQGVCPSGWQVAPREAWNTFFPLQPGTTMHHSTWSVGGQQGEWLNQSGLSLLPSGYRLNFGQTPFEFSNQMQFWFTQSDLSQRSILYQYIPNFGLNVTTGSNLAAAAVRCVKVSPDNSAPTAPTLVSPGLEQVDVSLPVRLEWYEATDPDGDDIIYEVMMDTVASPKRRLGEDIRDLFYEMDELRPNTTYYWKVRAKDVYGDFGDSEVRSFTTRPDPTNTPPVNPILLLPAAGGADVGISPTRFIWQAATDPEDDEVHYNFHLGIRPEFQTLLAKNLATTSFEVAELASGTTYYWKVVAKDGRGGLSESAVQSFTTFNRPPTAPELLAPINGNEGNLTEHTLSWGRSTDPDGDPVSYQLFIGQSPTDFIDYGVTSSQTRAIFGNAIPTNTTFYWKVIALDGKGGETSSEVWNYKTNDFSGEGSIQPTLKSPAHLSSGVSLNPTLEWETTPSTSFTYDVYVDDMLIANNLTTESYTITEFLGEAGLSPHKIYTWTVVGKDVHGVIGEPTPLKEWRFTTTNTPPELVVLLNPQSNAQDVAYDPTLTWQTTTDPDGSLLLTYDLYLDNITDPSTLVASGQDTTYSATWLTPNATYYWKVVATDPYGGKTSSEIRSFTVQNNSVNSAPAAPELVSPSNFDGQQSPTTLLNWNPSRDIDGNPITYDVYMDSNPSPTTIIASDLVNPEHSLVSLSANTPYYWKVVAKDDQGAAASSSTWLFNVKNTLPEAPVLVGPTNEVKLTGATAILEWQVAQDADGDLVTYDVYLDQFSSPNTLVSTGSSNLTYMTAELENNAVYYWKVVAKDPQEGASSSEVFSFSGQNEAPLSPVLTSPIADEVVGTPSVTLQWQASVDSDNSAEDVQYEVQIGTDPGMMQRVATVLQGTSYTVSALAENVPYHWQIIADDGDGGTARSLTESFTYQSTAQNQNPSEPNLVSPADETQDIAGSITLNWTASTDPEGDDISYRLYINETLISTTTSTTFDLSHLATDKTYTWQVVAEDENGNLNESPSWAFSTAGQIIERFTLSGTIQDAANNGIANVTLQGLPQTIVTNTQGDYSVQLPRNWNGTLTPVLTDYAFDPAEIIISSLTGDLANQDFTARYTGDYTLSGKVLDEAGNPLANVTMNGFSQPTITDANGEFSASEAAGWSGSITPVLQNYGFMPAKIDITSLDKDYNDLDFEGAINVFYEVKGVIKDVSGTPVSQVSLSGLPQVTTTNELGEFTGMVPHGWNGTVRPTLPDYTFQPSQLTFTAVDTDQLDKDFTATFTLRYTLTGTVRDTNGNPLAGVVVEGFDQQVSSGTSGEFSIRVAAGATGTLTAELADYEFNPVDHSLTDVQADRSNLDFNGTYTGNYQISGKILGQSNAALPQVVIMGLPEATITNADGEYNSEVPAGWSGTLLPQLDDYTFAPIQIALTNVRSDKTQQDFAATYIGNYTLSGKVLTTGSDPLAQVSLQGFDQEVISDAEGDFSVELKAGWSGVITPQLNDYSFSPADFTIDALQTNTADLQFEATYIGNYRISGILVDASGDPMSQVQITGLPESLSTDVQGAYQSDVPAGWSGTLTPFLVDYGFEPSQIAFDNVQSDQVNRSFTGTYVGNYTISGKVLDGMENPLGQVLLEGFEQEVMTNEEGEFSIDIQAGWTGVITPQLSDYEFSPASLAIASLEEDRANLDFEATYVGTYLISGKVIIEMGVPLEGVALIGLPEETLTDEQGLYTAEVPVNWSGTIAPILGDYVFDPASITLDDVSVDRIDQDYVATYAGSYTISGKVVDESGEPADGVAMIGFPEEVSTNNSGEYQVEVPAGWSGTITPTKQEFQFTPIEKTFSNVQVDIINEDFLWIVVSSLADERTALIKVVPNPSTGSVEIQYGKPINTSAVLRILSLQGKVMRQQQLSKGTLSIQWDGTDESGAPVPTGIYICQVGIDNRAPTTAQIIIIR
ncbi:MAG: FISUMP domain-containing protein [Cyclobacteriaceae bacterium]